MQGCVLQEIFDELLRLLVTVLFQSRCLEMDMGCADEEHRHCSEEEGKRGVVKVVEMEVFEEEEEGAYYCDYGERMAGGGAGVHQKGVVFGTSLFQHECREKTNAICCSLHTSGGRTCDRKKYGAEDSERGAAGCLSWDVLDQESCMPSRNQVQDTSSLKE